MAILKIECASISPRYNDDDGGTGFVEVRIDGAELLTVHCDGSTVANEVRRGISAVCAAAGVTGDERVTLMDKAEHLATESLAATRRANLASK